MINPFSLEGKTILVTGASSGLGRGIAIQCSKMGAKVVITARSEDRLAETLSSLEGEGHISIKADLTCESDVNHLVEICPQLNGCAHCAGIPQVKALKFIDRQLMENTLNINTIAPIVVTTSLLKKKKIAKGGSILFLTSISGVTVGDPGIAAYATSKGALIGFIKSAALAVAAQGIRVNTISPGIVPTNMFESTTDQSIVENLGDSVVASYPLKRLGLPTDIANGAVYLLSDASSWVTGINLTIDGGFSIP